METSERFFDGDTWVLMADGSMKKISKLHVGDKVMAIPHDNPGGAMTACEVTAVESGETQKAWQLNFRGDNGETLELTACEGHPFHVDGKGWIDVQDLEVGDAIVAADGVVFTLQEKLQIEEEIRTWSLTVDGNHTFFVGDGDGDWVLVHNQDINRFPPNEQRQRVLLRTMMTNEVVGNEMRFNDQLGQYADHVADGLQEVQLQLAMWPLGMFASHADDVLRSVAAVAKHVKATSKVIKNLKDLNDPDIIKGLSQGLKRIDLTNSKTKGDIFEEYIRKALGGKKVIIDNHEFDAGLGNLLIEAKAGFGALDGKNAKEAIERVAKQLIKGSTIAQNTGKEYVVISAVPIHDEIMKIIKELRIHHIVL